MKQVDVISTVGITAMILYIFISIYGNIRSSQECHNAGGIYVDGYCLKKEVVLK
jgi:hypothetical protein